MRALALATPTNSNTCIGDLCELQMIRLPQLGSAAVSSVAAALRACIEPYLGATPRWRSIRVSTEDFQVYVHRGPRSNRGDFLHQDPTSFTINCALSGRSEYVGGGTYVPLSYEADGTLSRQDFNASGIVLRPEVGTCLLHDGGLYHAGNPIHGGARVVLISMPKDAAAVGERGSDAQGTPPPLPTTPAPLRQEHRLSAGQVALLHPAQEPSSRSQAWHISAALTSISYTNDSASCADAVMPVAQADA